jgi:hypothetical protein
MLPEKKRKKRQATMQMVKKNHEKTSGGFISKKADQETAASHGLEQRNVLERNVMTMKSEPKLTPLPLSL